MEITSRESCGSLKGACSSKVRKDCACVTELQSPIHNFSLLKRYIPQLVPIRTLITDAGCSAAPPGQRKSPNKRASSLHTSQPQASSWTAWLSASLFAFASPELEAAFQAYLINKPNMWTLFNIGHCTVGWTSFGYKYLVASPEQRALLLDRWYIGCLHPIAALTMLGLLLSPAFYKKHRRALHAAFILVIMVSFCYARDMLLWNRQLDGPLSATLAHRVQSFATENFFGTLIWLLVLAYPVGQIPDLALTSLFLLLELAANPVVCVAASWLHLGGLVTMSGPLLRVVETVTDWILGTAAGFLAGAAPPPVMTCPLALAFWQVMGWWVACHLVFVAEIANRQAFLRTTPARNLVGPAHLASALNWPFGRFAKVLDIAFASLAISSCACVIWLAVLLHAKA